MTHRSVVMLITLIFVAAVCAVSACNPKRTEAKSNPNGVIVEHSFKEITLTKVSVQSIPCIIATSDGSGANVAISCDWSNQ